MIEMMAYDGALYAPFAKRKGARSEASGGCPAKPSPLMPKGGTKGGLDEDFCFVPSVTSPLDSDFRRNDAGVRTIIAHHFNHSHHSSKRGDSSLRSE